MIRKLSITAFLTVLVILSYRPFLPVYVPTDHSGRPSLNGLKALPEDLDSLPLYAWDPSGPGAPSASDVTGLVPGLVVWAAGAAAGPRALPFIFLFSVCAASFIFSKRLLDDMTGKGDLNYIPAFLYAFSPALPGAFNGEAWGAWVSYAFCPAYFGSLLKYLRSGSTSDVFAPLFFSVFAAASIGNFLIINLLLGLYTAFEVAFAGPDFHDGVRRRLFVFAGIMFLLNLYWLLPLGSAAITGKGGLLGTVSGLAMQFKNIHFDALQAGPTAASEFFAVIAWAAVAFFFIKEARAAARLKAAFWAMVLAFTALFATAERGPAGLVLISGTASGPWPVKLLWAFAVPVLLAFAFNYFGRRGARMAAAFFAVIFLWTAGRWFEGEFRGQPALSREQGLSSPYQADRNRFSGDRALMPPAHAAQGLRPVISRLGPDEPFDKSGAGLPLIYGAPGVTRVAGNADVPRLVSAGYAKTLPVEFHADEGFIAPDKASGVLLVNTTMESFIAGRLACEDLKKKDRAVRLCEFSGPDEKDIEADEDGQYVFFINSGQGLVISLDGSELAPGPGKGWRFAGAGTLQKGAHRLKAGSDGSVPRPLNGGSVLIAPQRIFNEKLDRAPSASYLFYRENGGPVLTGKNGLGHEIYIPEGGLYSIKAELRPGRYLEKEETAEEPVMGQAVGGWIEGWETANGQVSLKAVEGEGIFADLPAGNGETVISKRYPGVDLREKPNMVFMGGPPVASSCDVELRVSISDPDAFAFRQKELVLKTGGKSFFSADLYKKTVESFGIKAQRRLFVERVDIVFRRDDPAASGRFVLRALEFSGPAPIMTGIIHEPVPVTEDFDGDGYLYPGDNGWERAASIEALPQGAPAAYSADKVPYIDLKKNPRLRLSMEGDARGAGPWKAVLILASEKGRIGQAVEFTLPAPEGRSGSIINIDALREVKKRLPAMHDYRLAYIGVAPLTDEPRLYSVFTKRITGYGIKYRTSAPAKTALLSIDEKEFFFDPARNAPEGGRYTAEFARYLSKGPHHLRLPDGPDTHEIDMLEVRPLTSPAWDQGPLLSFEKVNPSKYVARVYGATGPFAIVLNETFDEGWRAYTGPTAFGPGAPVEDHFEVNGFANGWRIEGGGGSGGAPVQVVIEYAPQRLLYLGLIMSASTALGCVISAGQQKFGKMTYKNGR